MHGSDRTSKICTSRFLCVWKCGDEAACVPVRRTGGLTQASASFSVFLAHQMPASGTVMHKFPGTGFPKPFRGALACLKFWHDVRCPFISAVLV